MEIIFNDRVIIVTGGSRDIGAATCYALAQSGATVCINYKSNEQAAQAVVEKIKADGGKAAAFYADVTNAADVKKMLEAITAQFGNTIYGVVNMAGGLVARKQMQEMDESFWQNVMNINLTSAFIICKEVLPFISQGGAIVNVSSQAGFDGGGFGAIAYATAKGAIATFTRGMAKELGPKGIRVNAVAPGMISTTFHDTFTKPEVRNSVAASAPLRREGQANEVAELITYLLSDKSSYITGEVVAINGGTFFH